MGVVRKRRSREVVTSVVVITGCLAPNLLAAQTARIGPFLRPLEISSLGNYFSVVGTFHGKIIVFDDFISVKFDSLLATRLLPNDNQFVRLDSIRAGIGMGTPTSWSPMDNSQALQVEEVLPKGARIVRRKIRFAISHDRRKEDANAWIVMTFHLTVGRPGETGYSREATTYAHSIKGVLKPPTFD